MTKRRKKIICFIAVLCMAISLTSCGKKCANGCGESANAKCMSEMCDRCCAYWMGLNGCYAEH